MSAQKTKISDEQGVRARDKDLKNREASLGIALRSIMSEPMGRFWVWSLLEDTHIFGEVFNPSSVRETDFRLGEQNVGKRLLAQVVKHCPDHYVQAIQEAENDPRK